VPVDGGVQLVLKLAVDVPPDVLIGPLPLTPAAVVQLMSVYRVKVTEPVGAAAPVAENVAASPTVTAVPAVPVLGLACVVSDGDALPTVICSAASLQLVEGMLLSLASPA
jgi:hypothetical protein